MSAKMQMSAELNRQNLHYIHAEKKTMRKKNKCESSWTEENMQHAFTQTQLKYEYNRDSTPAVAAIV